jgi:hypothetical protein
MTTENTSQNDSSQAGGSGTNPSGDGTEGANQNPQTVDYETYRKAVDAEKAAKKRASDAEAKASTLQRAKDEAEGNWQKIAKDREAEAEKLRKDLAERDERDTVRKKANALINAAGVNPKYAHVLDYDNVTINPETGEVDQASLMREAERVRKEFPEILAKKISGTGQPKDDANGGTNGKITESAWRALEPKEMKKWPAGAVIWGQ